MKVLIADSVSSEGIDILSKHAEVDVKLGLKEDELAATIGDYEAIVVRSQTKVTAKVIEAGKKLQVIARVGAVAQDVAALDAPLPADVDADLPELATEGHLLDGLALAERDVGRVGGVEAQPYH